MQGALKGFFATLAAILYGGAAVLLLSDAQSTPGFAPNSFQTTLLDTGSGAIIAFITAQLGLAVANQSDRTRFRQSVNDTMGSNKGEWFLLLDVVVFSLVGLWFVLLALQPDWIAVPEGQEPLKDAPTYIDIHAKLFIGVVFAAVAAVAPAARN